MAAAGRNQLKGSDLALWKTRWESRRHFALCSFKSYEKSVVEVVSILKTNE